MRYGTLTVFAIGAMALITALGGGMVSAQTVAVPNPSFEDGENGPSGWTLSGGTGQWTEDAADGKRAISVTGTGKTSEMNMWSCTGVPFEPFMLYRITFQARQVDGTSGCRVAGPAFCSRDFPSAGSEWSSFTSYFITPSELADGDRVIRFGQWEMKGTAAYDAIGLVRATPIHATYGALTLGLGERISGREYVFNAPFNESASNYSRPLARLRCGYNTNRCVFGADSEVIYRHKVGDLKQQKASLSCEIGAYGGGMLLVDVSKDGKTWRNIAGSGSARTLTVEAPADIFPAEDVWVRLSARAAQDGTAASFQVMNYSYQATLDKAPADTKADFAGRTTFAAVTECEPGVAVDISSVGDMVPGGSNVFRARATIPADKKAALSPKLTVTAAGGEAKTFTGQIKTSDTANEIEIPYEIAGCGTTDLALALGDGIGYQASITVDVPRLYETGYGEILPGSTEAVGLWWASSGWKIPAKRSLPAAAGKAVAIKTARNEAEAAQMVIRPANDLKGLVVKNTALTGPNGATIPEGNVELLRVRYVPVSVPTDNTGVADLWPDPLPPLTAPLDVAANTNQAIWVRVKPPRGIPAGVYAGSISLTADGYAAQVPFEVTVFDFDLPDRMTCATAFGFTPGTVFQYQKVSDPAQQRLVYDKYLAALSAHHIGPYSPTELDPWTVTWPAIVEWGGGARDASEKHGGEYSWFIEDANPNANPNAHCMKSLDIPEKGFRVRFWYKAKTDKNECVLSLQHADAAGQWMSGRNTDIHLTATKEWQSFEQVITQFPDGAKKMSMSVFGAPYADNGSTLGAIWIDDVIVDDVATGKSLLNADFEPMDPAKLVPKFDWTAWDAAMDRAINTHHFNAFVVGIPGMGGGTFHSRWEPELLGYAEATPQYKAAFTNYCKTLESHLREKGWLDMSYIYWFDEPDPKDYEFVLNGFRKVRDAAPGIGRMLTEQVEPELVGGPNIWCPLTPSFDPAMAEKRRAEGDRFWWYVCTGPKAPYATLFIDHPGTELRVWLWQTWERRIDGILVWATNYWTSGCAYPEPGHPQNPYEDAMSWVSGYDTPAGVRSMWGNGDGRFIYPPEAAASASPPNTILDGPVDSIRFEMLRDGIEDYEYMAMLDRLIKQKESRLSTAQRDEYTKLLEVPDAVSTDLTTFTTDPAPIEKQREAVARALEALNKLSDPQFSQVL